MADEKINTEGGGVIKGDVDTNGDFIGRDRLNTTSTRHERTSNTNLSGNTIVTVLAVLIVGVIAALIIFRDRTPQSPTAQTVGVATTTAIPTADEPEQADLTNTAVPENTQATVVNTPAVAASSTVAAHTPSVAANTAIAETNPPSATKTLLASTDLPSEKFNLLASENGGQLLVASSDGWMSTINGKDDGNLIDGAAVYAFKDERIAIFDMFTVLIPGSHIYNIKEFELFAGNDSPTGQFQSIGKFQTQNVRLLRTPYQEFKFTPITAKYLKVKLIVRQDGASCGCIVSDVQLFGKMED